MQNLKSVDLEVYTVNVKEIKKPFQQIDPYDFKLEKGNLVKKFNKAFNDKYFYGNISLGKLKAGLYVVIAKTQDISSATIVSVSKLGIISKSDADKTLLYVVDKITGTPMKNVHLKAFNNEKFVAEGDTDKDGIAVLDNKDKQESYTYFDFIAVKDNDIAFINVYSYSYNTQKQIRAYFYSERPVYRPDQTVSFRIILRERMDSTHYNLPDTKEYKVVIETPTSKKIYEKKIKMNEFGCLTDSLKLEEKAELGWYRYRLFDQEEKEIYNSDYYYYNAHNAFRVEEYKKPEFKMSVKPVKSSYIKGEEAEVDVEVQYYFGQPVKDGEVEYRIEFSQYYRPYWYDYPFAWYYRRYYDDEYSYHYNNQYFMEGKAKTDKEGKCRIKFNTKDLTYDCNYHIRVRVTDKSRRMIEGSTSVNVAIAGFRIDLNTDKYVYKPGDRVKIKFEGRDINYNPVDFEGRIKITKYEYKNNKTQYLELINEKIKTESSGAGVYEFIPDEKGNFYVTITSKDKSGREVKSERNIYVADYSYQEYYNYSSINILFDKDFHYIRDKATAMIQSPIKDSYALITFENERLLEYKVVSISGTSKVMDFTISEDLAPNFYYNVCIIKDNKMNTAAKNLIVPPKEKFLNVEINPDKETYKPGEEATIQIKVTDNKNKPVQAELSLGLVDESLYYIQEEFVQDIREFFYSSVWNYVSTANSFYTYYYGRKNAQSPSSEAAGSRAEKKSMAADESKEMDKAKLSKDDARDKEMKEPEIREYFPDTGYWNAGLKTDKHGIVTVKLKMPDTLTTWRSTVRVITKNTSVGSGKMETITFKTLLARLELPRFMVQGDNVTISGIVHNYLKSQKEVRSELKVDGVNLTTKINQTMTIKTGDEHRFDWKVSADKAGKAQFILTALSDEESDGMKLNIPVLPHGLKREKAESGFVKDKDAKIDKVMEVPQSAILESSELQILVTGTLAGAMLDSLDYLIGYPYGCVEQTMSRFLPDIIVAQTIQKLNLKKPKILEQLPDMVDKGLKRLYELQHYDGGWGWWTNDETHPYMTAYVVYGLTMARLADYKVVPFDKTQGADVYERGVEALKNLFSKEKTSDTKAYMAYVLSYIKDYDKNNIIKLYHEKAKLTIYGKALLSIALVNKGEKVQAKALIKDLKVKAVDSETFCYFTGESFHYSWERNDDEVTAFILKALATFDSEDAMIPRIINWLLTKRNGNYWVSTKDTANVVYAFAEYLNKTGELDADFEYKIMVNNKELINNRINSDNILDSGKNAVIKGTELKSGNNVIQIIKKGKGKLYYTLSLDYFNFEKEIKAESKNISVKRAYHVIKKIKDKNGNETEKRQPLEEVVNSGEEIEVTLTVSAKDNLDYIMIEDYIPAGCEILNRESRNNWWTHQEFRDEKAVFFMTHYYYYYYNDTQKVIKYRLRAEIPGDYEVLPTIASSMYYPEVHANTKSDQITILEKK